MKAFISYATDNKKLAHGIKENLEIYGVTTFLAHDDIKPTEEWQDRILEELHSSQIFIPVLTDEFPMSAWTDQEVGIALSTGALIIPIKVTINPYGFIARYQALKLKKEDVSKACYNILHIIAAKPLLAQEIRDLIIGVFGDSSSFSNAEENAEVVASLSNYTSAQFKRIANHILENSQIYNSFGARDILRPFIDENKKNLPRDLYSATIEKLRRR